MVKIADIHSSTMPISVVAGMICSPASPAIRKPIEAGEQILPSTTLIGIALLWMSAIFTIYTGWDYFRAGIHHLIKEDEG